MKKNKKLPHILKETFPHIMCAAHGECELAVEYYCVDYLKSGTEIGTLKCKEHAIEWGEKHGVALPVED